MNLPAPLESLPFHDVAFRPAESEAARHEMECHSAVNAAEKAVKLIERIRAVPETAGVFSKTVDRLDALLGAMKSGRSALALAHGGSGVLMSDLVEDRMAAGADNLESCKMSGEIRLAGKICKIVQDNVDALLLSWEEGDRVREFLEGEIFADLRRVLETISLSSLWTDRPFRVAFDATYRRPDEGLFTLRVRGPKGRSVEMPASMLAAVRDMTLNARKYSAAGSEFWATVEESSENLTVSVGDRGIGIPEAVRADLGRYGFRAPNARAMASGHGLGLAKTAATAEEWRGLLRFRSAEGVGTEFRVVIPKPYLQRDSI